MSGKKIWIFLEKDFTGESLEKVLETMFWRKSGTHWKHGLLFGFVLKKCLENIRLENCVENKFGNCCLENIVGGNFGKHVSGKNVLGKKFWEKKFKGKKCKKNVKKRRKCFPKNFAKEFFSKKFLCFFKSKKNFTKCFLH